MDEQEAQERARVLDHIRRLLEECLDRAREAGFQRPILALELALAEADDQLRALEPDIRASNASE